MNSKLYFRLFLFVLFISISLSISPIFADTTHCGTISVDETWNSANNVHIVSCTVDVASGTTLTIAEGAIVKFEAQTSLTVSGSLRILGTASNPVYFTSIKDDTIGGDTNGDGGNTTPTRGDWGRIEFRDSSDDATSLIDNTVIRYGGADFAGVWGYFGAITLDKASPTIQNTTIVDSEVYTIKADWESSPTLLNNTLIDNNINGLSVQGGTINSNTVWNITDTSYHLIDDLFVAVGATLTVNPDVIVKFGSDKSLIIDGALRTEGTASNPVYFTSIKDDTIGGDTNGDGGNTTPTRGDWGRIEFRDSSDDATSLIDNTVIRYGGADFAGVWGYFGAITLDKASPTIQNTTIVDSEVYTIKADWESSPTLLNNTLIDNNINGLSVQGGTINSNTVWNITDTSYHLIDDLFVAVGATLTVNPDVIVKFGSDKSLIIDGALRTEGTASNPVYFTSIKDDTIGGDTNGDGGNTTPTRGDWGRIEFRDSSDDATSLIDNTVIRYGGADFAGVWGYFGAITLDKASPTIQNTTIVDSEVYTIKADWESSPTLLNNTLIDNNINGLSVQGGTINSNTVWNITDTSYHLIDNLFVAVGATLTVNPDVIVKFGSDKSLIIDGALRTEGTASNPVYFTSIKDDTIGGDTNGDGGNTTPTRGDWGRIEFRDSSDDATSLIDNTVIRYGGADFAGVWGYFGAITLDKASPTIQNTTITESEVHGIRATDSTPSLICNDIFNNGDGLFNLTTNVMINAENQWWGSISGPYNETANPSGNGNGVNDGVDFSPWLTTPCNSSASSFSIFLPTIVR